MSPTLEDHAMWLKALEQKIILKKKKSDPILIPSIHNPHEKLMQLWMEIIVLTLHKFTEVVPQPMCAVIKAKRV